MTYRPRQTTTPPDSQTVATPATGKPISAIARERGVPPRLRLSVKPPTEQRICRIRASELGSDSRGGGKRTVRRKVSKGKNRGFFPLVHLFWYFSRCITRKVHPKQVYCPFLSVAREKGEKSATKGKDPRSSPLETSPLFCACSPLPRSCRAQRGRVRHIALSSRRFVRHPQRGRSDTRRGQPVGWQPKANSQRGGTIALGRAPRLAITKRLPRLLLSDQSGRLPATALLQRRCGSVANHQRNSAFAVPE